MEREADRKSYDVMFSEARFSVVAILEQTKIFVNLRKRKSHVVLGYFDKDTKMLCAGGMKKML